MQSKTPTIMQDTFGMELVLDLCECSPEIIRSSKHISEYAKQLCDVIEMKAYGAPFVERFGLADPKTAGYSLVQLIETSSITGHFSEAWNKAYINIFSCKTFDTEQATEFTKNFFGAGAYSSQVLIRK